jgi:hypothetical protein
MRQPACAAIDACAAPDAERAPSWGKPLASAVQHSTVRGVSCWTAMPRAMPRQRDIRSKS